MQYLCVTGGGAAVLSTAARKVFTPDGFKSTVTPTLYWSQKASLKSPAGPGPVRGPLAVSVESKLQGGTTAGSC